MSWGKDRPTAPGWYWFWQPAHQWPCRGKVQAVEVTTYGPDQQLEGWVPFMDYADRLDCDTWENGLWLAMEVPEAPKETP